MPARIRSLALALATFIPATVVAQQAPATSPAAPALTPPVAAVRPHRFDEFGTVRIDQYYWLKDRNNPDVIKYLKTRMRTPRPSWPPRRRCRDDSTTS